MKNKEKCFTDKAIKTTFRYRTIIDQFLRAISLYHVLITFVQFSLALVHQGASRRFTSETFITRISVRSESHLSTLEITQNLMSDYIGLYTATHSYMQKQPDLLQFLDFV